MSELENKSFVNSLREQLATLKEQFKIAKENHEYEYASMLMEDIQKVKNELKLAK